MDRFNRNVQLFGVEGQEKLRNAHVAIVGCGGLGSHVAIQSAYLGIGELTLIDDELISKSNMNRYVTARHTDLDPPAHKVDIAARSIAEIDPDIKVNRIHGSIRTPEAFTALSSAHVLVGCLDNDGARMVIMEFALAYRKDYFDLASDVSTQDGLRYGGRVLYCGEGVGCPVCLGEIDVVQAQKDLENDAARQDRNHIYGVPVSSLDEGGPSVVTLNGVVASLGMTELMVHLTGLRSPNRLVFYRGHQGIVTVNREAPSDHCYYCGTVKGAGPKAGVERYIKRRQDDE